MNGWLAASLHTVASILESSNPGARLEGFPGTGHLFFWEEPERFVEVVKEFLGE